MHTGFQQLKQNHAHLLVFVVLFGSVLNVDAMAVVFYAVHMSQSVRFRVKCWDALCVETLFDRLARECLWVCVFSRCRRC